MGTKFDPINGSIVVTDSNAVFKEEVNTFADLPDPTTVPGQVYSVRNTTGVIFINRQKRGLYKSDGTVWEYFTKFTAEQIPYNNTSTGIIASNIQGAIDAIKNLFIPSNLIIVKQPSDFGTIDSSKVYLIDTMIDMTGVEIEIPVGGLFLRGHDYFVSGLYTTDDNSTLFVNSTGQDAGNVRMTNIEMYCTGTNSKIFDLDNNGNFGAVEFNSCNFGTFAAETTSLGEFAGYRQFRTSDAAFIRVADGFTFSGIMAGGLRLADSIILAPVSGAVLFKEGTSLIFNDSVRSDLNGLSVAPADAVFDFVDGNFLLDWGFNLDGARFPIGSNAVPNIPNTSTKRYFRDCRGVQNTFPGGDWTMVTQLATVLTAGTLVQANGNVAYNDLVHFSGGPLNTNQLVYDSNVTGDYVVTGNIVVDGGPNDQVDVVIRQFDDSAGTYIDLKTFSRQISNVVGGLDVAYYQIAAPCELDVNDRIEVWLRNNTDNTNATVLNGSFLRVDGR